MVPLSPLTFLTRSFGLVAEGCGAEYAAGSGTAPGSPGSTMNPAVFRLSVGKWLKFGKVIWDCPAETMIKDWVFRRGVSEDANDTQTNLLSVTRLREFFSKACAMCPIYMTSLLSNLPWTNVKCCPRITQEVLLSITQLTWTPQRMWGLNYLTKLGCQIMHGQINRPI